MPEARLIGGNESDRKRVLEQQQAYLDANAKLDWETLRDKIWSGAPEATFFNLNGHAYNGRDHWVRLWQYYKQHMMVGDWVPFDIGGVIGSDVAVTWCHRRSRLQWIGNDRRPMDNRHQDREFVSRSSMVFHKENGDWRVVHVHFSEASSGERPGNV